MARSLHSKLFLSHRTFFNSRHPCYAIGVRLFSQKPALRTNLDKIYPQSKTLRDRELIFKILNTYPSQREAKQFLKQFAPENTTDLTGKERTEWILSPTFNRVCVIKVIGPFSLREIEGIAATMTQLKKLGMMPIIVVEDLRTSQIGGDEGRGRQLIRDAFEFAEVIEKIGGRARPVSGVFTLKDTGADTRPEIASVLEPIQSAFQLGQIPVVVPIGFSSASTQVPFTGDDAVASLVEGLSQAESASGGSMCSPHLQPSKVIIVNREGGPRDAKGAVRQLVNLEDEYDEVVHSSAVSSGTRDEISLLRKCLAGLPLTSSGIIVPAHATSTALIANLITDKPDRQKSAATVFRHGWRVREYRSAEEISRPDLTQLLEASFGRTLNSNRFYERLEKKLLSVIIAGDYYGAVVVTSEPLNPAHAGTQSVSYMDKFAIDPKMQGVGLTDLLWKRTREAYPDLMWRSRATNGINKWYFERADGYYRVPDTQWVMFWYGKGVDKLGQYSEIVRRIPPSFE
ncbi:uncharacterized protein VTP21DRAFT_1570 [Calcarisporiella thermophila]|uniref:uncharacterized protein n=1 Tax=Calcarisporiella thermophila TaxID=911321 RepID=UPI0037430C63